MLTLIKRPRDADIEIRGQKPANVKIRDPRLADAKAKGYPSVTRSKKD